MAKEGVIEVTKDVLDFGVTQLLAMIEPDCACENCRRFALVLVRMLQNPDRPYAGYTTTVRIALDAIGNEYGDRIGMWRRIGAPAPVSNGTDLWVLELEGGVQ